MVIHRTPCITPHKNLKHGIFLGFWWKSVENIANFAQKWLPQLKIAKTRISRFLNLLFPWKRYKSHIGPKWTHTGGKKTACGIFHFFAYFQNGGHFYPQIVKITLLGFWWKNVANIANFGQKRLPQLKIMIFCHF